MTPAAISARWTFAAVPLGLVVTLLAGEGIVRRPKAPTAPVREGAAALASRVDVLLEARWAKAGVRPAPDVDDLAFLRRVWLDLLGTIPSLEEIRTFEALPLAPGAPRRAWVVDRALADPRSSVAIAEQLARIAVGKGSKPDDLIYRRRRLVDWLARQVSQRRPWDALVRELLTAEGASTDTPAVNFTISQDKDPLKLAARTARAFLGVRIDCAQCHDHPFLDWKQTDFEGLAAFFGRVEREALLVHELEQGELELDAVTARGDVVGDAPSMSGMSGAGMSSPAAVASDAPDLSGAGMSSSSAAAAGAPDMASPGMSQKRRFGRGRKQAATAPPPGKRWVAPAAPYQPELVPDGFPAVGATAKTERTRREALAAWVTSRDNRYFARAFANRVWAWLIGRGLVEPVDELDAGQPWSPELLAALEADLRDGGFDIERLIRGVVLSRAYRVGSAAGDGQDEAAATAVGAVAPLKPLRAEQLAAAITQATSAWTWDERRSLLLRVGRFFQSIDFVTRHGGDPDAETAEDETMLQRLHLMNGQLLSERTKDDDIFGPTTRLPLLSPTDEAAVEGAFLMVLTRRPTAEEAAPFLARLKEPWKTDDRRNRARAEVMADLLWALANTTEFAWSH